jgi:hypothetical protein
MDKREFLAALLASAASMSCGANEESNHQWQEFREAAASVRIKAFGEGGAGLVQHYYPGAGYVFSEAEASAYVSTADVLIGVGTQPPIGQAQPDLLRRIGHLARDAGRLRISLHEPARDGDSSTIVSRDFPIAQGYDAAVIVANKSELYGIPSEERPRYLDTQTMACLRIVCDTLRAAAVAGRYQELSRSLTGAIGSFSSVRIPEGRPDRASLKALKSLIFEAGYGIRGYKAFLVRVSSTMSMNEASGIEASLREAFAEVPIIVAGEPVDDAQDIPSIGVIAMRSSAGYTSLLSRPAFLQRLAD